MLMKRPSSMMLAISCMALLLLGPVSSSSLVLSGDSDDERIAEFQGKIHRALKEVSKIRKEQIQSRQQVITASHFSKGTDLLFRHLEGDEEEEDDNICKADGIIAFDDDDAIELFGAESKYQSSCSYCVDQDNADELGAGVAGIPLPTTEAELVEYVEKINAVYGDLVLKQEYTCETGCEVCYTENNTKYCTIHKIDYRMNGRGKETNFTIEDFAVENFTDSLTAESLFESINLAIQECYEFTENNPAGVRGTACLFVQVDVLTVYGSETTAASLPCTLSHNGKDCSSCSFTTTNDEFTPDCYVADCSNLEDLPEADRLLNNCAGKGIGGVFSFLGPSPSNDTLGSCDAEESGTKDASSSPSSFGFFTSSLVAVVGFAILNLDSISQFLM